MKRHSRHILAVATLAAVIVALALVWTDKRHAGPEPEQKALLLASLKDRLSAVDRLKIDSGDTHFDMAKQSGQWRMLSKYGVPANEAKIGRFLIDLSRVERVEQKTSDPAYYGRLGLGDEATQITVAAGADSDALYIGKMAPSSASRHYARLAGEEASWLVEGVLPARFRLREWLGVDLPVMTREETEAVAIIQPNGEKLELSRASRDDQNFTVDHLPKGDELAYPTVANSLGAALAFLDYEDLKPVGEISFDKPVLARYRNWDGLEMTLALIKADKAWWAKIGGGLAEGAAPTDALKDRLAAIEKLKPWAFKLPDYKAEELSKKRADLLKDSQK